MPIDSTALLSNIKGSITKFIFDNLQATEGLNVTFDETLEFHQSSDKKWIDVRIGMNSTSQLQYQQVQFACATREDANNDNLVALRDTLLSYLTNPSSTSGFKSRIVTLYDVSDPNNLVNIGSMQINNVKSSGLYTLNDSTKYMLIEANFFYGSKI